MNERYVYLKHGNEIVKQQHFSCESENLTIIEKWKKLYGKKFTELTVTEDAKIVKEKPEQRKAGRYDYGHILNRGKKSFKGSNKFWNGYKD